MIRELLDAAWAWLRDLPRLLWEEYSYAVYMAAVALVRAAGKTVESGQTGLKYTAGRVVREVEPGFYPLLPFVQVIRTIPTRSRTLDLPQQRVTNLDGLVFDVDANVVFQVTDVRKALIEIDNLGRGMLQMLGLGVQQVLRARERRDMYCSTDLNSALAENLAERLAPWGVTIQRAGFSSITPSNRSIRVTQQRPRVLERARRLVSLRSTGVPTPQTLALLGVTHAPITRTRSLRRLVRLSRRRRMTWKLLDEALAEGRLHPGTLPRRYRGVLEERAIPVKEHDPRRGSLIPAPQPAQAPQR